MPVIEFEPTWISVFRDGERVRTSEPIETASSMAPDDPYTANSAVGFDAEKILDFINHSDIPAYVYFAYDVINHTNTGIFINRFTGEETIIAAQNVGTSVGMNLRNFVRQVSLDDLTINGENMTFREAIESGYTGLGFRKSGTMATGINEYENVAFLLEGEWVINAPSNLSPAGGVLLNVDEPVILSWNHNGSFEQKTFELRYRLAGDSEWNTITEESSNQEYELTSLEIGEYEWQVRTTTDYDYESSWSGLSVFSMAEMPPTPSIIHPEEGEKIGISDLYVEWDHKSDLFPPYELELYDESGNFIAQHVFHRPPAEHTFESVLDNNSNYRVRVRVLGLSGLYSAWAEADFSVDYTEAAQPEIIFVTDKHAATITVYIENPEPTGTYPEVLYQHLYRRRKGETEWMKIADSLENNAFFIDYTPASNVEYEYRVRMYADNETSAYSIPFITSVKVKHVLLNLTSNTSEMLELMMDPEKSFETSYSATTRMFAGRRKPVTEFGETIEQTGTIDYTVDEDTLPKLYEFLERQETLLYRDSRGRKQYVTIASISVTDDQPIDLYTVSLSLSEVDYNEAVL